MLLFSGSYNTDPEQASYSGQLLTHVANVLLFLFSFFYKEENS